MRYWGALIAGVLLFGGGPLRGHAQPSTTVGRIVAVGDPTPVGGAFAKFDDQPSVNEAGDVAFVATVEGGKAARAIFLTAGGTTTRVVAEGDPTPVGGTFEGFLLGRPSPTKSGAVIFLASVAGGKASRGIFLAFQGVITKLVAEGDPTPIGGTFGEIEDRPSVANGEIIAWTAAVTGGSAPKGIFLAAKGTVSKVVALGDSTPLGGTFTGLEAPSINAPGAVVFIGAITGGAADAALFLASGGKITPLVRAGEPAPGTGGERFLRFKDADLSDGSRVSFRAFLGGGKASEGFYLFSQGTVAKLAAGGDQLPEGRILEAALGRPVANARGAVAFKAHLLRGRRGAGWEGIYVTSQGTVTKVVVEGDPTPVGGTFGNVTPPSLSDSGAIVFRASVLGGPTSEGIFLARQP